MPFRYRGVVNFQASSSSGWNDFAIEKTSGNVMSNVYIKVLQAEILRTQKYSATHLGSVHVQETLESGLVWEGDVEVFRLDDHPTSRKCYAWKEHGPGAASARYVVVPQTTTISSPSEAVRAHNVTV
jgi:hypothetical protein